MNFQKRTLTVQQRIIKGIMNGIDSVVIATGNDWRAIEAGAYAMQV